MNTVIHPNGVTETIDVLDGEDRLTLDQMQKAVGGCVELVHTPSVNWDVYANEEGLLIGLEPNMAASLITGVPLVGSVLICDPGEVDG